MSGKIIPNISSGDGVKDKRELPESNFLFESVIIDKRLGLELYKEHIFKILNEATFDIRYGLGEYFDFLLKGTKAGTQIGTALAVESIDIAKKTGEAIAFGTLGIISDRVFLNYGFPGVIKNYSDEKFNNLYSSYFSFLEEGDDTSNKKELCNIFKTTKTFVGRKHIFEELFHDFIGEYKVLQGYTYSTQVDGVLRSILKQGNISLSEILDIISHNSYNKYELSLHFNLLYNVLGERDFSSREVLNNVLQIVSVWRKGKIPINKSDAVRLTKTITLLKIKKIPITIENIEKHKGLYVYIPSILSSTHGEDSSTINLMKGFVKSHKPSQIKSWEKQKKWLEALIGDGENIQMIKKYSAKGKIFYNRFLKLGLIDKGKKVLVKARNNFGEKKMDIFLGYIRKNMPNSQGELSPDIHKELMKQYYLIDAILNEIEHDVRAENGEVIKTPKSRILKFLIGRGKSKSISPFAAQAWIIFMKFPLIGKLLAFIPIMKFTPILLIAKTSFIYLFYKIIDLGIFFGKQFPTLERIIRFAGVNGKHSIGAGPELQDVLIQELQGLRKINRDIQEIQQLKKLVVLQKKFESNLYDAHIGEEGTKLSDEDVYERTLLENEISALESEIDKNQLGKEIVKFKLEYLRLLEEVAIDSNRSFSEDYIK